MRRPYKPLQADDPRHGKRYVYTHYKCRCDRCEASNTEYFHALTRRLRDQGLSEDDPRHGRDSTYKNWMCRCSACRTAHTVSYNKWKQGG